MEVSIVINPSNCYPFDDCSVCIKKLLRQNKNSKGLASIGCFAERPNCLELKNKVIKVIFSFRDKCLHQLRPQCNHI